jgi:hypothetical protein
MRAFAVQLALYGLCLASCTTAQPHDGDSIVWLRLGQSAVVDGPTVTPLRILADSRCPKDVQCAWAGDLRVLVRIGPIEREDTREMVLGQPQAVADGTLELASAVPEPVHGKPIALQDYRLGFRFAGGL